MRVPKFVHYPAIQLGLLQFIRVADSPKMIYYVQTEQLTEVSVKILSCN
jgi:hypothetical protein